MIVASSLGAIPLAAIIIAIITRRLRIRSLHRSTLLGHTSSELNTTAAATATNATDSEKNIAIPVALSLVVPCSTEPYSGMGSAMISCITSQTPTEEEISISDEARKARESLKELITGAIKDAKDFVKGTGKGKRLKEETIGISATTDSRDIQS